jgi:hypothetical protein
MPRETEALAASPLLAGMVELSATWTRELSEIALGNVMDPAGVAEAINAFLHRKPGTSEARCDWKACPARRVWLVVQIRCVSGSRWTPGE